MPANRTLGAKAEAVAPSEPDDMQAVSEAGTRARAATALGSWGIAPGIHDPQEQATVVDLTRILLLSPLFLGLGGWAMGILNARQHFALPAFAPVAYNLAIIGGALFLAPFMGVYGLAW